MASVGTPAETRDYIIERLVGETGEPDRVTGAARAVGERALAGILQGLTEELALAVDVELKRVDLTRFAEAKPKPATHAAVTIAGSPSSPDALLIMMDGNAIGLIVGLVFGGDPDMPASPIDRDPSPTEVEVAGAAFAIVARALNGEGPRALGIHFPLPAPISGIDLKRLTLRDTPAVRLVFGLSAKAGQGEISVVIPQRVLLKHRGQGAAEEQLPGQDAWSARFGEEVMRATVEVVATMPATQMTLGELSMLAVGQVVPFEAGAQSRVRLAARDRTLFTCEFGRLGQNYSVRIGEPFETTDLMDGLLSAQRR